MELLLIIFGYLILNSRRTIKSHAYHGKNIQNPTYNVETINIDPTITSYDNNNNNHDGCDNNYDSISIQSSWKIFNLAVGAMDDAIEASSSSQSSSSSSSSFKSQRLPFVTLSFAQTLDGSM